MTDQQANSSPEQSNGAAQISPLPVHIHAQYIKDFSLESPNAPQSLGKQDGEPALNVDLSMDANKIDDFEGAKNTYEVTLSVSAHAKRADKTLFIAELQYGMAVSVGDIPSDQIHPLLLIEMPHYLFPYVRQIIGEATQRAGFMPLMLSPVNFAALYQSRFGQQGQTPDNIDAAGKEKETA